MKYAATLVTVFFLLGILPARAEALREVDRELTFILANYSILLEKNGPEEFPARLRLIQLPDRSDDCSELINTKTIPVSFEEGNCPRKILYLTLSNWDLDPPHHVYRIGEAYSWRVKGVEFDREFAQANWTAAILLETETLTRGKPGVESRVLRIVQRNDEEYALSLEQFR